MTTYAGIVRVSSMAGRQAGSDDFHSERDQTESIRKALPDGARIEFLPSELDVSGGKPLAERPSLLRAVEGVERGDFGGIAVAYQSRLFRNVEEEEAVWRRVEAAGGEVLIAIDPVDNKTVDGRMVRRIKASINTAERERHRDEFARRAREATAEGIWQRRQTPKGYSRDPKTRRLIPNKDTAAVRDAFHAKAAGTSLSAVARKLGMTTSGARQLLKNRVYLGELRVRSYVNPTAHPAIITTEEFEAAQGFSPRPARSAREPALLAGLVVCAGCGHKMTRGGTSKFPQYICPVNHSGERCPAPASISVANLDAYVSEIAKRELERLRTIGSPSDRSDEKRRALEDAERQVADYLKMVDLAGVGVDIAAEGLRKRQDQADRAREELRTELAKRPLMSFATGSDVWEKSNTTQRNTILRGLLTAVVVERSGGRGIIRPLTERVVVVKAGVPFNVSRRNGGSAIGIHPVRLDNFNEPDTLGL